MKENKVYKFIVFGDNWDVYLYAYRDFIESPDVTYFSDFRQRGIARWLHRLMFNPRLNHIVDVPFKPLWNKRYTTGLTEDCYCFLIFEKWLRHESATHFLPYLRNRYPNSKIVCYLQDLVHNVVDQYTDREVDVNYIKKYADLVVSYDPFNAQKYGMEYIPTVFSPIKMNWKHNEDGSDLYFLGRDKGRLNKLIEICKAANSNGLKCKFLLLDIPKKKQVACYGITYIDRPIPYTKNIENVYNTKCVLEVLQTDAASSTFRMWEVIASNRKLLTNNLDITKQIYYDPRYISTYSNTDDIDWRFVVDKKDTFEKENPYLSKIRPDNLIKVIEEKLDITTRIV